MSPPKAKEFESAYSQRSFLAGAFWPGLVYCGFMFSRRTSWNLAPNAFSRALEAHRQAGREVLDLTLSNPTEAGLHYDEAAILGALANPRSLVYSPSPKGLAPAREAVAGYYSAIGRFGLGDRESSQLPPWLDSIILTVSTSEAYSFLFRLLCEPADEILVPTPSYPLFEFLADLQDVRLIPYPLFYDHGWHVDLHGLESRLSACSRAILLVHPNNPTGSYIKRAERAELNRIAAQHGLALIVDEVFLDYAIGEDRSAAGTAPAGRGLERVSSFVFNRGALTFTLSGISKLSGLPQMKLAWIVVSGRGDLAAAALARLEVIADTYLSLSTPIQLAAPLLLAQGPGIRQQLGQRIQANLDVLDRELAHHPLCARLQVEGGWYAILRVPVTRTDEELAIALLKSTGVLVQPGYFYNFSSEGHLVLSLITPEATFAEGVKRLLQFVDEK